MECISVGYLIRDEDGRKTIAPHIAYPDDEEQCQGNGIMVIPDQAVISIQYLTCLSSLACAAEVRSSDHQGCEPSCFDPLSA